MYMYVESMSFGWWEALTQQADFEIEIETAAISVVMDKANKVRPN